MYYYSSVLRITISLREWFCCAQNGKKFSYCKAVMDWRWWLFCINAAYCHLFEREHYESYYFNCALTKSKRHILSRRLLVMAREKGQKSIFFKTTLLQVWAFDVFYFLDNTLSITVFTLSSVSRKNYVENNSYSEAIFSLVSIQCFSALKFSLAKMASESAKLTSQNGISTSLWLVGYR